MIEQLQLFPTEEGEPMGVLEADTTTTQEQIAKLLRTLGDAFEDALDHRSDVALFNWLVTYGMPAKPGELRYFIHQLSAVTLGWCAANGYITFTEKALASEEELASRPANEVEAFIPDADTFYGPDAKVIEGNFGQYL